MMYNCLAKGYTFSCLHFLLSLWVLDVYRFLMVALILSYLYQQFIPVLFMQSVIIIHKWIYRFSNILACSNNDDFYFFFFLFCYVGRFIYYTTISTTSYNLLQQLPGPRSHVLCWWGMVLYQMSQQGLTLLVSGYS